MAKIAFIAPDMKLLEDSKQIALELDCYKYTDFYSSQLNDAVNLARTLEASSSEVDAIISRYGTAYLLSKANLSIPVIEVMITGQDLAQAIYEAKKSVSTTHPRFTYLAFGNMANDIIRLSKILDIDLHVLELNTSEDIRKTIDTLSPESTDVLMGGATAVRYAASRGFRTQLVQSGDCSLREAFRSAQKVLLARSSERKRTEEFRTIVNAMREGILCVNTDRKLQFINHAAEKFLQKSQAEVSGKRMDDLIHPEHVLHDCFPYIHDCLENGRKILDKILKIGPLWINFNFLPIIVNGKITGAAITSQDVTQIQEMEIKIRNEVLTKKFIARYTFDDIRGGSPEIAEAKRKAREFSSVDATVLLFGESGTGKELFAQSIHNESPRANGPFVAINCAALPMNLLESELFGYVDGAFTGARRKGKPGLFEMAHRGTIFLDEISEMAPYGQSRLLRVLQERQVMRLGDDKYIPVDVRIIAATNKKLPRLVSEGLFRQDLFYRLKILTVTIPPLRQRSGDILFLSRHFLQHYAIKHQRPHKLEKSAEALLTSYFWPGNVRELRYFIERLIIIAREFSIDDKALSAYWEDRLEADQRLPENTGSVIAPDTLPGEAGKIEAALLAHRGNISKTAIALQMDRSTLYRKLRQYQIQVKKSYE